MKTFAKIAAIAVIAVMAAVSCTPQAELTDFDWGTYNKQYDPSLNTTAIWHTPVWGHTSRLGVNTLTPTFPNDTINPQFNQEVDITFDPTADVLRLRDSEILGALQRFLSFHHFTNPSPLGLGQVSTLTEPGISYTFVRRNDNVITVRLGKQFSDTESDVIMRISAANYTFSNGMRMDRDQNGIAGEAFYDDYLRQINVSGNVNWVDPFLMPGNQSWFIVVSPIILSNFDTGNEETPSSHFNFQVWHTIPFVGGSPEEQNALNAILGGLTSSFRLQRNNAATNWNWEDVNATVEYDVVTNQFRIPPFNREHLTAYRVVYIGTTNLTTEAEFFGGRQRIRVVCGMTWAGGDRHDPGIIRGGYTFVWNTDLREFVNTAPVVNVYSSDSVGQNVVLEITFPHVQLTADPVTARRHLDNSLTAAEFIANFRLAYARSWSPWDIFSFQMHPQIRWIDIVDVEFLTLPHGDPGHPWNSADYSGIRRVRVTLDPAYNMNNNSYGKFIHVNDRIRFNGGLHTFGNPANWQHGFSQLFSLGNAF